MQCVNNFNTLNRTALSTCLFCQQDVECPVVQCCGVATVTVLYSIRSVI